jgi:hypothetical protein
MVTAPLITSGHFGGDMTQLCLEIPFINFGG